MDPDEMPVHTLSSNKAVEKRTFRVTLTGLE